MSFARRSRHGLSSLAAVLTGATVTVALGPAPALAATGPLVALGAYVGSDAPADVDAFETLLRSPVAITSSFRGWRDIFPDPVQRQQAASGHTLLVAWDLGDTAATRFTTFTSG